MAGTSLPDRLAPVVDKILRVITANLANGDAAIGSLRKMLEREQPDVGAFQELDPAQARVVEQHFGYGKTDPRRDYHGMGIGAVHPIEVERFPMTHRDGWKGLLRESSWPQLDRDVELLNVHIQNPLMSPLRETAANRRGQIDDILAYVGSKRMSRVVLGDMNASPSWRVYKRLAGRLQDAAVAADTAEATWSYFSPLPRLLRIDHVFIEGLVALETRVVRIKGTDHSALIADLYTV